MTKRHKLLTTTLACALAFGAFTGCTSEKPAEPTPPATTSTAPEAAPATKDFDASAYFIDQEVALAELGLTEAPASAIALGRAPALLGIDAGANMIGIPDDHHIPEEYLEAITNITDHDGNINWGQIKDLQPDLLLLDKSTMDKFPTEIADLGVPTYVPTFSSYDDTLKKIGLIASAFDSTDAASKALENRNERLEDMRSDITEPKSIALLRITADGNMMYAGGNYADSLIKTIGVENIATTMGIADTKENSGMVPIALTDLVAADPDGIAVMVTVPRAERDAAFAAIMEEFAKDAYKSMTAVTEDNIARIDHHPYAIPGMLPINGVESVFTILYE